MVTLWIPKGWTGACCADVDETTSMAGYHPGSGIPQVEASMRKLEKFPDRVALLFVLTHCSAGAFMPEQIYFSFPLATNPAD
jgi:hypothetical protein